MLLLKQVERSGEGAEFRFNLLWFFGVLILFFGGTLGSVSGMVYDSVGWQVAVVSTVILLCVPVLLLTEAATVFRLVSWIFAGDFSYTMKTEFPTIRYLFVPEEEKSINGEGEKRGAVADTVTVNVGKIAIEIGVLLILQALLEFVQPGLFRAVLRVVAFAVFGLIVYNLSPAYKGWWWSVTGKTVSWDWNGSAVEIRVRNG